MVESLRRAVLDNATGFGSRARAVGLWVYTLLAAASLAKLLTHGFSPASPPWHLLDLAFAWWVALSFVVLQVLLGRRLAGVWLAQTIGRDATTIQLACFVVGFWASSIAFFLLAWLRMINGLGLLLYLLAAAVVVIRPSTISVGSLREAFFPSVDRRLLFMLSLGIAVLAIWLPYFIQTLLPNSDWDGASTHLPLATWFRVLGLKPIPLDHSHLMIPGTTHLVYAVFQAIGAEQAIIPLNFVISLATCLATATIASRYWGRAAGWWGFAICLSINLVLELGLDPRIDGFLAFFCTTGAIGIMIWLLEGTKPGAILLAAIAFGCALGTKLTAVFPLILWGLPVLIVLLRRRDSRKGKNGLVLVLAAGCLFVPSGYWYASSAVRFGDPIYPYLRGHVVILKDGGMVGLDDAVADLIAEARLDEDFVRDYERIRAIPRHQKVPRSLFNPVSLYFRPGDHARKPAHLLSPLLLLFFGLPVFRRDKGSWLLYWMGLSVFLVIGSQTHLVRYGMVVYPLLAAGAGIVVAGVRSRWWKVCWTAALALVLVANIGVEWKKMGRLEPWSWLSGERERIDWLSVVGYNQTMAMPRLIRTLGKSDERHPPRLVGKTFMLGEAKTHLFPFDAIPDVSRTARPWLSALVRNEGDLDQVHRDLWAKGIRYILLNYGYFRWVKQFVRGDHEELVFSLFTFSKFNRSHGQVVFDNFGMILIRLEPPDDRSGQ